LVPNEVLRVSEHSEHDLLGCNAMWFGRQENICIN
jgi:hypothetical protein